MNPTLSIPAQESYSRSQALIRALFGWLLAIPYYLYLVVLTYAAYFAAWILWWVGIFTGSYQPELRAFIISVLRLKIRGSAYILGLKDGYPSFSIDDEAGVLVTLPEQEFSRGKAIFMALFGWITLVIWSIFIGVFALVAYLMTWINFWFVVVTGKAQPGMYKVIEKALEYQLRLDLYMHGVYQNFFQI